MYQYNPYAQQYNAPVSSQIVKVNGENGAHAYQMMPNSSALLLDETAPLIWLAQTDGAGYKTVTAYEIKPYAPPKAPDFTDINERLKKLEAMIYESNITNHNGKQQRKSGDEPDEHATKRKSKRDIQPDDAE